MDVKYDTTPCDGTPGQPWEDFKRRLRNVATRSDDRGFSLADHYDDVDEGGGAIAAPAIRYYSPPTLTRYRTISVVTGVCVFEGLK